MVAFKVKILKFEVLREDLDKLATLPERMEKVWLNIVIKTILNIQRDSQGFVPIDQGVAKASHYIVYKGGPDSFTQAVADAMEETHNDSRWGHKHRSTEGLFFDSALSVEDESRVLSNSNYLWGFVCIAVTYGFELETGFESGSLNVVADNPGASRPFLTPAVIENEEPFLSACRLSFGAV